MAQSFIAGPSFAAVAGSRLGQDDVNVAATSTQNPGTSTTIDTEALGASAGAASIAMSPTELFAVSLACGVDCAVDGDGAPFGSVVAQAATMMVAAAMSPTRRWRMDIWSPESGMRWRLHPMTRPWRGSARTEASRDGWLAAGAPMSVRGPSDLVVPCAILAAEPPSPVARGSGPGRGTDASRLTSGACVRLEPARS